MIERGLQSAPNCRSVQTIYLPHAGIYSAMTSTMTKSITCYSSWILASRMHSSMSVQLVHRVLGQRLGHDRTPEHNRNPTMAIARSLIHFECSAGRKG